MKLTQAEINDLMPVIKLDIQYLEERLADADDEEDVDMLEHYLKSDKEVLANMITGSVQYNKEFTISLVSILGRIRFIKAKMDATFSTIDKCVNKLMDK